MRSAFARCWSRFIGALLIGVMPVPELASAAPSDVRVEFSLALERILYAHPAGLVRGVGTDGANGVNREYELGRGPGMFIEGQRHGEEAIMAGLAHHDPRLWRIGLRELDWGFAHQGPQGNFPATQDPFHSTSFVEAVAHLTLVLRGAAADGVTLPAHLLAQVNASLPRLHAAARWMARTGCVALGAGRAGSGRPQACRQSGSLGCGPPQ
jgi:hypothetical protein